MCVSISTYRALLNRALADSNYLLLLSMCAVLLSCSKVGPFFPSFSMHIRFSDSSDAAPAGAFPPSPINMNISCNTFVNTILWSRLSFASIFCVNQALCAFDCDIRANQIYSDSVHIGKQTGASMRNFRSSICRKYYFNYCVCDVRASVFLLGLLIGQISQTQRHSKSIQKTRLIPTKSVTTDMPFGLRSK